MSPERVVAIIRKNVRFENEEKYKKWDGLPMDVRWILKEAVRMIECQEEYIESLRKKIGGQTMDAVEFLETQKRMCKKYRFGKEDNAEDFLEGCKKCPLCNYCTENLNLDCEKCVEVVENWAKTNPEINLTEQQKTAIRGRIAEGYRWVARDKGEEWVYFSVEKPYECEYSDDLNVDGEYTSSLRNNFYSFVTFENSPLYLPDLLGGEE